ncbi:MAG: hypothetical protein ACRDUY_13205 [Nitriliruptorales bacterium]
MPAQGPPLACRTRGQFATMLVGLHEAIAGGELTPARSPFAGSGFGGHVMVMSGATAGSQGNGFWFDLPDRSGGAHGHSVAIGSIVDHSTALTTFAGARLVNADRLRIPAPWDDGPPVPAVGLRDLDGSVVGRTATVVADNPLLVAGACEPAATYVGHLCPAGLRTTMLRLEDHSGGTEKLGPTTVVRADGARHLALSDPDWARRPLSQTAGAMDTSYRFAPSRTPTDLEVVAASDQPGWVEVGIPWPHATVHVHDGWGEWARVVQPAASRSGLSAGGRHFLDRGAGILWLRFSKEPGWQWQRQKVCVEFGCGEGLSARRR